jgi:hypothetical protein
MSINKLNLSTTADGADIFFLTTAGDSFANTGNLTTSGALASAIRVEADGVSVVNKGTLTTSGDGSPAVTIGTITGPHYDNVTVTNYGTIHTTGTYIEVPESYPDGIDAYGNNNTIINYGTIIGDDFATAGLFVVGNNSLAINYGTIDSAGFGMASDSFGGTEYGSQLINYGTILFHGEDVSGMRTNTVDGVIKNFGIIKGDTFFEFGMYVAGTDSYGENRGTILMTGDADRGVVLEGEGHLFINYGSIKTTGEGGIGARYAGNNPLGTDGGTFVNYGSITSTGAGSNVVRGSFSDDHFVNYGKLVGDADMRFGDDSYTAGKGGSLSGTLTLGDGDDLIIFEKGGGSLTVTDFVAGAGTDDVINLGAYGFSSFAQVMTHASQSGADVVLNLGGKDKIVLQDVTLAQLHPDDFDLTSVLSLAATQSQGHHDLLGLS